MSGYRDDYNRQNTICQMLYLSFMDYCKLRSPESACCEIRISELNEQDPAPEATQEAASEATWEATTEATWGAAP